MTSITVSLHSSDHSCIHNKRFVTYLLHLLEIRICGEWILLFNHTEYCTIVVSLAESYCNCSHSSCFRNVHCIWMPRMVDDFSEIHCSSKKAGSVYARYCSFLNTPNFTCYTPEMNLITTAFINFVSGKSTAYCCSEW